MGIRSKKNGLEAVQKLHHQGIFNVESIQFDVTNVNTVREARQLLETKIGSLDILINNAGTGGKLPQDLFAYDLENLREIFETNFFGVIETTQEFLPLLKKSG